MGDVALSRRALLLGGAAVTVLGVVGCGDREPPADGASGPGRTGEFPATVEHRYGSTTVPAAPRRVVTLGLTEQDYVLAFGAPLVGATEWFGAYDGALWPWAREALGEAPLPEVLTNTDGLNIERIAALRPDLVVCTNGVLSEAEYDRLSEFAPTVAAAADFPDYGTPWPEQTRAIGAALGRPDDAERMIADLQAGFDRTRTDNPAFDGASAIIAADLGDGTYYLYAEGPAPGFLSALGFRLPATVVDLFDDSRVPVSISTEQLDLLADADLVVWGVYGAERSSLPDNPLYSALPVATEGRSLFLPERSTANGVMTFGSVLSLPAALDELVPRFAVTLDGDPATVPDAVD